MRKLFTFLLTMVVAMVANAAITPTIQLGEEFKSVADLDGKTFAIVNKAEQKALFGSSAQNLGYDVYSNAFVTTNSGYLWKLVSLADNADESIRGYYMLRLITPSGGEYNIWGNPGFLNTQPADQAVSFILGITGKKNGQDIDNGAVYDVQYEEGKGFSLKNIGTGLYQGANTAPAKNEEPTYFTFATVTTTYVPALKALLAEGEAMKKRGASSADYDAAIEGIDPDKSADALADAQKVEAALPALAKTQLTAGSDFTRAIANFDCAAKDGWTFDKPKGGNGPDHGGDFEYWAGNASNRAEASFDYWQEITGLPNGTYTVSAEMYNSLNNEGGDYTEFKPTVGVYATVGEKTVSKLVDVNSETRVPYVTDAIEVTDGKIRIGAKSFEAPMAARWFTVDNFKLTLVKPAVAPTAPEKDAWYTGADFFRFRADKNATAESPYYAWKDKVEPVWGADADDVSNGCIVCNVPANVNPQSQIWIRGTEAGKTIANGSKDGFKITFRVKADGEYTLESQAHNNWGYKTGQNPFGPLNVTTEWQTVSFVCTGEKAKNDFTDLCFNLSGDAERTIYFDDVQIVRGSEWYVNYGDIHAKDFKKDNPEDPDPVYADSDNPYPLARFVADDGVGYVEVVTNAKRNNPWDSQIWIGIPSEYVGKITKMTMQVWADEAVTCSESYHATATGKGWGASAKINEGKGLVTEADKWIDITRILNTKDVKCNGVYKNMQVDYYCLDLSNDAQNEGDGVIYRFRNLKFEPSAEDWYTSNVFTVDGEEAPYIYGTGEEGGYVEVAGGKKLTFGIPEALQGGDVKISMKVKAAADDATTDITYTTAWADASIIVEAAGATYDLTLPAAGTFDFDEIAFEKYYKPIDYGKLVEIPVEGTLVKERDFTTATSWTHNPSWASNKEGYTDKLIVGEGLEIVNNADQGMWESQFFIIEDVPLQADKDYAVRYTLKYDGEGGDMQINLQAGDWSTNNQAVYPLAAGPIYTQMVHTALGWTKDVNANVFFQSGAIKGRMIVEKVEVFDITPDYAGMAWSDNILKNGDLKSDDMSEFFVKNNDVEDPETLTAEKTAIGEGAYEIDIETAARPAGEKEGEVGGNDYDAQFYIRLPYVLPKGSFFNLEFDIYAEASNTIAIQANVEPGQYKGNLASVKTDASGEGVVHFQKYLRAPEDMRTIAFNLAVANATSYGFSNMKVQIVNDDKAAIDEATATADAATLWAETLALNEACYAGRITETEGYTAESVKALTDAIAAGKAALAPADGDPAPTKESLTAAAKAITDAIAGLKKDAPALAYTDLTKEMFFHWNAADETAEALEASNCDYNIGTSTGQPYGLSTVNHDRFADLSAYNTIELTATEGEPRLLFNRIENEGTVFAEVPRDKDKYETVVDNGDGSKTYVIDIAAIVAEYGFAHLHAIKGANWANTTVTEIKLGYAGEKPALPIPTAIEGVETAEDAVKDGKYFINGQIVIVKNGVKYNAAGVAIK